MKRISAIALVMLVLVASLFAGGSKESSQIPAAKDSLTVALASEPRSLDPFGSNDSNSTNIKLQVYDTLLYIDTDASIQPNLAEKYEWVDGNTLQVTIRKDVKFHNGDLLKASDVLYTLQHSQESEYTTWIVEGVNFDKTVCDDEAGTVSIVLNEPSGSLPARLCQLIVVSKSYTEKDPKILESAPMGTGPFLFDKWVKGDSLTFKANKDYWKGAPAYSTLILRSITESATRTIEIKSGNVDVALSVIESDVESLSKNPDVKVIRKPGSSNTWIGFNCTAAPFDNQKVRQAVCYAIDKKAIVDAVYSGIGSVATGPIPPSVWGYTADVPDYSYNPAKAKQLLAEAGYANGLTVEIKTSNSQVRVDIAEIVQQFLKEVGITVKISTLENATYLTDIVNMNVQMFILGWETTTLDADYGLYEPYHSGMPTWSNTTGFSDPEVDRLLDEARRCIDMDQRRELYRQAQIAIVEGAPAAFLWDKEDIVVTSSHLDGITMNGSGRISFYGATFK
ncbi:MAG: ABC transporter substrate-binding protein [Candidatus Cloacimonetes bacterium]|nr:ABC transporter substrate-binding protein [Candidatus Cloacimonadota bacterium]